MHCHYCYLSIIILLRSLKQPAAYHWRELPQVSFLSRQKFWRDKHMFDATKHVFCHDKSMFFRDKYIFVATKHFSKVLSRQAYFCRDTRRVLPQQTRVCRFVAAKWYLWRQWYPNALGYSSSRDFPLLSCCSFSKLYFLVTQTAMCLYPSCKWGRLGTTHQTVWAHTAWWMLLGLAETSGWKAVRRVDSRLWHCSCF